MRNTFPPQSTTASTPRSALWAALVVAGVLAGVAAIQYGLALRTLSGSASAAAPADHAADAKAVLAAYEENLLDPAPAIATLLDEIAARPGVAEAALVNAEGVEIVGGSVVQGAELVAESAPPACARAALGDALDSGKAFAKAGVVAEPIAIHEDPHALVVLREPVPAVVPLSALQWIVPITLAAAALLIPLALGLWNRSLAALQAAAVLRAGMDPLTGLGAHRLFREELSRQAGLAVRRDRRLSLVLFDIDHFAELNKAKGLRHGDATLAKIGAILRAGRSDDLAFRFGGDEFAVLFLHTAAAEAAVAVERIRTTIAGRLPGTTVSAGIAQLEPEVPGAESLLAQAELALHDAKAAGRDRLVVFDASAIRATR